MANKQSESFIHKFIHRETFGGFKKKTTISASELFDSIPESKFFELDDVFDCLGNHIFMGVTQCGRFLLTYTINRNPGSSDFMLSPLTYTLHLWSFSRARHKSKKVAEILLFSGFCTEILTLLNISVAQWPTINDKLIIYGESEPNCPGGGDIHTSNTFLTIAHLPALETCLQCRQVAETFQKSDMIIDHEYNILSNYSKCLKHGLNLDAMFYLAHPHPKFDISINIKYPNTFLVNTGNFLHILSTELHNTHSNKNLIEINKDSIINERVEHKINQKVYKNSAVAFKKIFSEEHHHRRKYSSSNFSHKKAEQENFNIKEYMQRNVCEDHGNPENMQHVKNIMAKADKIYAFEECEDGCELKFKWFRKRKLADKMYEFCSDEDEMENARFNNLLKELRYEYEHSSKPRESKVSFGRFLKIRLNPETNSQEVPKRLIPDDLQCELSLKTDLLSTKPENCDISSIISDWESQDTNSLSPKSDISNLSDFSTGSMPGTSSGIRFSLKNKKPRLTLKKYTCTNGSSNTADTSNQSERQNSVQKSVCVILKPQNRLFTPAEEHKVGTAKSERKIAEPQHNVHFISGCSFEVARHFIIDEDDYSNESPPETDVDCCEDGTQVPIVVRGPGCNWSSKLKLLTELNDLSSYEFCQVKQKTVDIEQFCFKAADLICKMEHFVFRSCNDYDVEIIDVCPFSGDVIAIVSIKMNAESVKTGPPFKNHCATSGSNSRSLQFLADIRQEFDTSCVLIWNVDTLVCSIEAYSPLKPSIDSEWSNNQAQELARKIKSQNIGFFNAPSLKSRSFVHKLKKEESAREIIKDSLREIEDRDNLVGFRLCAKPMVQTDSDSDELMEDSDTEDLDDMFSP